MKRIIPKIGLVRDPETNKLVPGVVARDPRTRERLPAEGILVDRVDSFWKRREAEDGVTIEDEPEPEPMVAPPPATPGPRVNAPAPAVYNTTPSQPAPAADDTE